MDAKVGIDAGVCGFHTAAQASSDDGPNVTFRVESGCEKIRTAASALVSRGPVDAYQEIAPEGDSVLLGTMRGALKSCCAGCVVPSGLFKLMQVCAGLALPKDIVLKMSCD